MRDSSSSPVPTMVEAPNNQPTVRPDKTQDTAEKASKVDHSQLEYQGKLGLTQDVEEALAETHAYIWKRDEHGNLLIRSTQGDPKNPRSWPNWKRYGVVGLACLLNNLVGRVVGRADG
jgi:hypothetical protein